MLCALSSNAAAKVLGTSTFVTINCFCSSAFALQCTVVVHKRDKQYMFSSLKIVLLLVLLFVYTHSINSPQVAMVSAVQKLSSTSLIVFHRHGHRATGKGIFATDIAEWSERVCRFGEDKKLDYRFPVINYNVDTKPVDKNSYPFGAISKIGASHMQNVGKSLLETFPCLHNLTTLRTKVHSTNYQRTQVL